MSSSSPMDAEVLPPRQYDGQPHDDPAVPVPGPSVRPRTEHEAGLADASPSGDDPIPALLLQSALNHALTPTLGGR